MVGAMTDEKRACVISALALLLLAGTLGLSSYWSAVTEPALIQSGTCEEIRARQPSQLIGARELSARVAVTWGMALALTAIGLVLAYCYTSTLMRAWRYSRLPVALMSLAVAGAILGLAAARPDGYLFSAYATLLDCVQQVAPTRNEQFHLAAWGNALLVFATVSLIGSVWQSILDLPVELGESTGDVDARDRLREVNDRIVLQLYLGSALLVTAIISLYGYYSWPLSIVAEPGLSALESLAVIIAVSFGTIYTLVLAFVFGPAILVMNNQALRLARQSVGQGTEFDARNWIVENGLRPSGIGQGTQVVAVLGPLLTGPILELLSFVG